MVMPYAVCDARDLKLGHVGLIAHNAGIRPVFPVQISSDLYLLMLPTATPNPNTDFRLKQILSYPQKVLDLGSDYLFECNPFDAILLNTDYRQDIGLLTIIGSDVTLNSVAVTDQFDNGMVSVVVKTGSIAVSDYTNACQFRSWRLLLPSKQQNESARLLSSWTLNNSP